MGLMTQIMFLEYSYLEEYVMWFGCVWFTISNTKYGVFLCIWIENCPIELYKEVSLLLGCC